MTIETTWVDIPVENQLMKAYTAYPQEAKTPLSAVIVLMEIFGINAHIQEVTERLAHTGYFAIAIDYYHRVAPGVQLDYTPEGIAEGRGYKSQVTHAQMLADIHHTCDYLSQHPFVAPHQQFGLVGFCFGGYVAFVGASLPQIAATASFYGAGIPTDSTRGAQTALGYAKDIHGEILCLFGEKDDSIPKTDRAAIETAFNAHGITHQCITFPNADHGFFCDKRSSYESQAAQAAWEATLDLFKRSLGRKTALPVS